MKTTAFLTRVAICFLLSLIPLTELENAIYSARMEVRGRWGTTPNLAIIEVPSSDFENPEFMESLRKKVKGLRAKTVVRTSSDKSPDLASDSDGVVRKAFLFPKGKFSLAYIAAQRMGIPLKPTRGRGTHLINYAGEAGTIPHCTPSDLGECGSVRGRIAILAETEDDPLLIRTPLGEMSKAEILANDINTVVYRHGIYRASWVERVTITLAMILLAAFYIIYYPVLISAIAVSGTGVAVVIILFQLVFHAFDVYIPSANIGASLLFTYLIFTGYRLAFQENLQWRSLKQAQYLRELDQMKTNFLSLVSHDLKTPLAKIQALTERMRRELPLAPFSDDQRTDWKELVDSIENSNNELKHYVTSILNLSRIESQKVIVNKKSNDVNRLIQQTLRRLGPLAQQKGVTIEESLDPLFSIECDEDLVRQVLANLIDNAIKYSPENARIHVRSREDEGFVRVEIEDFGPGIPKDQLPLMFRKFSRFLRPIKEQVKGTGLGLYLSKYFIELHGGTIQVKSVEGQGTTFTFTLPLHSVENEAILG